MCPVYINRIASIHAESSNEKPYFSAQEPDYKQMDHQRQSAEAHEPHDQDGSSLRDWNV